MLLDAHTRHAWDVADRYARRSGTFQGLLSLTLSDMQLAADLLDAGFPVEALSALRHAHARLQRRMAETEADFPPPRSKEAA